MEKIIKLDEKSNDSFSKLKGIDLQELLVFIENCYLEYRSILGFPDNLTFGTEIEYENVDIRLVEDFINSKITGAWNSKMDSSLDSGGEIASEILVDSPDTWEKLKTIYDFLIDNDMDSSNNAGGHIHSSFAYIGDDVDSWKRFLKFYILYEPILFRFLLGDKISARTKLKRYAPPIAGILYAKLDKINKMKTIYDLQEIVSGIGRYAFLSFDNVNFLRPNDNCYKNTTETRGANAPGNATVAQNNINAICKMYVAAKNGYMDEEYLNYRLKKGIISYEKAKILYENIILKDALEFVDFNFDNNKDKIYFLRQYLKNFENNPGYDHAVKAKRFVR